jgi:prepilin-type processing-associated H-X9-DG protein
VIPAADPNPQRPWSSVHAVAGVDKIVHINYGLNARTENNGWPFVRWPNDTSRETTTLQLTQYDKTVMLYDGVWTHNSAAQRVYARHGNPRSITNMAFFDGRVESIKTRLFDVGGTASDVYPRFRQ